MLNPEVVDGIKAELQQSFDNANNQNASRSDIRALTAQLQLALKISTIASDYTLTDFCTVMTHQVSDLVDMLLNHKTSI